VEHGAVVNGSFCPLPRAVGPYPTRIGGDQAAGMDTNARLDVRFRSGESYEIRIGKHHVLVDQPADAGGQDTAPTPTELFVASLAGCVAFYAGRYLKRHGLSRDGLGVTARFEMAPDRPARVSAIHVTVRVPDDLPERRRTALQAVVSHCTVHNSLTEPPAVTVDLANGTAESDAA
jgi:putative redox protein